MVGVGVPTGCSGAYETLTEDEARFIDFERSSFFITEEHPILER